MDIANIDASPVEVKEEPSTSLSSPPPPAAPAVQGDSKPPKRTAIRKRTKTGCLTCRKRRIKCDEGKPTCGNCIKSKRQCDGYNQRLTFKEPLGSFGHGSMFGHATTYQHQAQESLPSSHYTSSQVRASSSQGQLPIIAPRPPPADFTRGVALPLGGDYQEPSRSSISTAHSFSPGLYSPPHGHPKPLLTPDLDLLSSPSHVLPQQSGHDEFLHSPQGNTILEQPSPLQASHHPSISASSGKQVISPADSNIQLESPSEEGYWQSDDDASMASSEDEAIPDRNLAHLESNGPRIISNHPPVSSGVNLRTFSGTISSNMLQTYTPSSTSSPLNDPQTAAVFWHFVNVTGRIMSLYERNPVDSVPMFQGVPVPRARQSIWTYVFPVISFSHPALMQAMLALGSLQIAKRQGLPPTAAMKHYHLSLRRVAKNYQSPIKRTQSATLAATLLLGFYEVWNSDHEKWCKHMWGARAIIREIPLGQMTRDITALERKKRHQLLNLGSDHQCDPFCQPQHDISEHDPDWLDVNLIAQITGKRVKYGDTGYVVDDTHQPSTKHYTERDIESYEHIRDLYWWYCKMDVYQAVLGATPLFMEYEKWTQCAPRAQFGRIDALYGTFDHLMLLLGRVVDFAYRDMARKRKAKRAEAQRGPPPQGMPPGPIPNMFPGLVPSSGRFDLPRGFSPPRESPPSFSPAEDNPEPDLETQTAAAIAEWESIREAFEVFRAHLGPDFAPMGPDFATPVISPFGPALLYRTYSIAGIWLNYYMGLIVLYRARPSMPPIAMVAAGMSAPDTARWANEIGRITAGLHDDTSEVEDVSTLVGSVFLESGFCLFVAAIQYRDTTQRHWTVRRLYDIERLTGWQSARQIADGCESAWFKAASMKRGPEYTRPAELGPLFPTTVWGRPRRIDTRIRELEDGSGTDAAQGVGSLNEENKLVLVRSEQSYFALGLLSVEQDFDRLDLVGDGSGKR